MGCCGATKAEAVEDLSKGGLIILSQLGYILFLGIVKRRGYTDLWCVGVFGAFIFLWFLIGSVAFDKGDPKRLLLPTGESLGPCSF